MEKNYRKINREVMSNTYKLCSEIDYLKASIKSSIKNLNVILEGDVIEVDRLKVVTSNVFVSSKRTLEAASFYKGKKVAVLNFANNHSIGGSPFSAGAQEESICRCSTLFPCLKSCKKTFYQPHIDAFENGELDNYGNSDIIYIPNVTVFKTDESEPKLLDEERWYNVDVITCAAPQVKRGYDEVRLTNELTKRIERILDVASLNNVEVLILGAFGCGAFGNPPLLVAQIFKKALLNYQNFETIEFAVFTRDDSTNYDVFNEVLGK